MAFRLSLFSHALLLAALLHFAASDYTSTQLLEGINSYRASLNLSSLTENNNAACLAEQLAKQFKGQECSNTTGSDTVPGTEQQFPNYPDFLNHCHLNVTDTQDAAVMPVCVPGLDADLVLTNYTKTQYNEYLNESRYIGAGIADEGNWVVVVLSTDTASGSFSPASESSWAITFSPFCHLIVFLLGFLVLLMI